MREQALPGGNGLASRLRRPRRPPTAGVGPGATRCPAARAAARATSRPTRAACSSERTATPTSRARCSGSSGMARRRRRRTPSAGHQRHGDPRATGELRQRRSRRGQLPGPAGRSRPQVTEIPNRCARRAVGRSPSPRRYLDARSGPSDLS